LPQRSLSTCFAPVYDRYLRIHGHECVFRILKKRTKERKKQQRKIHKHTNTHTITTFRSIRSKNKLKVQTIA
jgi:hypothetical protein